METKYIVVKMYTGEELIGILHEESNDTIMLINPMQMQHEPDEQDTIEHYWAQPFCVYSDEKTFFIQKKHIVYVKRLSEYLIPHYESMVENFSESEVIKSARLYAERKVSWGGKEITEQEAHKRAEEIKYFYALEKDEITLH